MLARIYQPTKSSMQSGDGDGEWLFEFIRSDESRFREDLMARTSSNNMMSEVKIYFKSLAEAEEFAQTHDYNYEVIKPNKRKLIKRSYSDNFC